MNEFQTEYTRAGFVRRSDGKVWAVIPWDDHLIAATFEHLLASTRTSREDWNLVFNWSPARGDGAIVKNVICPIQGEKQ